MTWRKVPLRLRTAAKSPIQNNAYPRLKNTFDRIRSKVGVSPGIEATLETFRARL